MNEPHTTLRRGPSDGDVVPTADFVNGRNTVMVATEVHTTCPPTSAEEVPLRSSGLGTRAAVYEQQADDATVATFVGWSDEVALERTEAARPEQDAPSSAST